MSETTILIVEDEVVVAMDIQMRLRRLGHHVVGLAGSGEEALRLAEAKRPDLALMDIRLKGELDGIQTAEQLRTRFGIPVIYLTAYADDVTLQRAKLTEPFGYLLKPFEERELHSTLEIALYKIDMERRLRLHMARLNQVLVSAPDGVALLDGDFRVMLANEKARRFLTDLATADPEAGPLVALGGQPVAALAAQTADGQWVELRAGDRIYELNINPAPAEAGQEYVAVLRDVTRERDVQQHIRQQERLAAVGQFAAGMAHDFNNAITSIILDVNLIRMMESGLSAKTRSRLDAIGQQANRAGDLVRQVLDFSRTSAVELRPLPLLPLFRDLVTMLRRILPAEIAVHFTHKPGEFVINGDVTRIMQLVMNLALNARDAMPQGGALRIDLAHRLPPDASTAEAAPTTADWVALRVSDTGRGMDAEQLAHIFDPFYTTKGPEQGAGLGLSQVYGIVQQHGGQISVAAAPGEGAVFSILFPSAAPPAVQPADPPADLIPAEDKPPTILVVEDNTTARRSLADSLELLGYRVLTAENGRVALALLDGFSDVDLIMSDLLMPEMDGAAFCRELRKRPQRLPVIILTGYLPPAAQQELRGLGVVGFVDKPVAFDQMARVVAEMLGRVDAGLPPAGTP